MAMMARLFISEWRALTDAVQAARQGGLAGGRPARAAEHARLRRKWMRKQIGLAVAAFGAMVMFLHGMVWLAIR